MAPDEGDEKVVLGTCVCIRGCAFWEVKFFGGGGECGIRSGNERNR